MKPLACLLALTLAASLQATSLNILLITTDDQGMDVGCYGAKTVATPHLDRLASMGTRFDRAYVTQASCSSSRSSILTGTYPHQNGQIALAHMRWPIQNRMHDHITSYVELLHDAGYTTSIMGKLHVKPESKFPFDHYPVKGRNAFELPKLQAAFKEIVENTGEKPFFTMINFSDPHYPFNAQVEGFPLDPVQPEDVHFRPPFDTIVKGYPAFKKIFTEYLNGVQRIDTGVGMFVEILEENGLMDNTVILFVSDHGEPFYRAKGTIYERGVRVPMILRVPRTIVPEPNPASDELVSTVDIAPTILELAGLKGELAEQLEGTVSLLDVMRDPDFTTRDYVFTEFNAHGPERYCPQRVAISDRYKLVYNLTPDLPKPWWLEGASNRKTEAALRKYGSEGQIAALDRLSDYPEYEFYDLQADPHEHRNLVDDATLKPVMSEHWDALSAWMEATDDPFRDPTYIAEQREKLSL